MHALRVAGEENRMSETVSRDEYLIAIGQKRAPKKGKYRAEKQIVDGITFDSKREAARYGVLVMEQRAGRITNLRLQVKFAIVINRVHCTTYIADFTYERNGVETTEDAKGFRTEIYRLKKKLVEATYGIVIQEV